MRRITIDWYTAVNREASEITTTAMAMTSSIERQRRSSGGRERGADLRYNMEISLEESFTGKTAQIRVPTSITCDVCTGTGAKPGTKPQTCGTCQGAGRVRPDVGCIEHQHENRDEPDTQERQDIGNIQVHVVFSTSRMKSIINPLRELFADPLHTRQVLHPGPFDFPQAAELLEQLPAAFRPHAGNGFQHRGVPRLLPPAAVPHDGEAVRLVADLLDQVQRR